MKVTGKLKDLTYARGGEQILSLAIPREAEIGDAFDELMDVDVDITIVKHRKRRSNDANAYCWVLCTKLAETLSSEGQIHTKDEIYRDAIRSVGVYRDVEIAEDAEKTFNTVWSAYGTGWFTERVDSSREDGKIILRLYYGSSQYNTKCMSRLIDNLVQDCKALGIETATPDEINYLMKMWQATERKSENG